MCHHQLPLWLLTEEERTSSGCDESCIWLSGQVKTSRPMDVLGTIRFTERIGHPESLMGFVRSILSHNI